MIEGPAFFLKAPAVKYMQAPEPIIAEYTSKGLAIPYAAFCRRVGGSAGLAKLLKKFTVTARPQHGCPRGVAPIVRRAFAREGDTLYLPRAHGPTLVDSKLLDGVRPIHTSPLRVLDEMEPLEPLYPYQEAAVRFCLERLARVGVVNLQMDTGLGKSRVGLAIAVSRRSAALVVVPTEAIAHQWLEEAEELFPELRRALYHNPPKGSRRPAPSPSTHDLVVIIVNTFREKAPEFVEGYGTVILDESHEYHSPCNGVALWLAQAAPAVLGLTATPLERPDGLDRYISLHLLQPVLSNTIPGFDASSVCFRGTVRAVMWDSPCDTSIGAAGTVSAIATIGNILRVNERIQLVAAEALRLYWAHTAGDAASRGLGPRPAAVATAGHPAGEIRRHGVFVFAELRESLIRIRDAIIAAGVDDILAPELAPVSVLRGGVSAGAVTDARAAGSHIVLTTYGFSRRGISLPDMTSIVLATPRRNGSRQILGRILRRGSDESIIREVVDIVDTCTGLKSQFSSRKKVYIEKKWPIDIVHAAGAEGPAGADTLVDDERTTEELLASLYDD